MNPTDKLRKRAEKLYNSLVFDAKNDQINLIIMFLRAQREEARREALEDAIEAVYMASSRIRDEHANVHDCANAVRSLIVPKGDV